MPDNKKTTFENINDLIKATIWPLIIIVFLICYGSEINTVLKLIPDKLNKSSKVTIGSLSFEIEKSAKESGNSELGQIIKNLSEKGVRKLLTSGSGKFGLVNESYMDDSYSLPADINVLEELDKNGLLKTEMSIADFVVYFKSLNPIEKKRYSDSNGSDSSFLSDKYNFEYTELKLLKSQLNTEDTDKLNHFYYELSESGKKAFEIIITVIAEQIKN